MATLKGIYSSRKSMLPSIGAPRKGGQPKRFFVVWEHDPEYMIVQPLNHNLVQVGHKRLIPLDAFEAEYEFEPDYVLDEQSSSVRPVWRAQGQDDDSEAEAPPKSQEAPDTAAPPEPSATLDSDKTLEENRDFSEEIFSDILPDEGVPAKPLEIKTDDSAKVALDEEPIRKPKRFSPLNKQQIELQRVEREAMAAFGLGLAHLKRGSKDRAKGIFTDLAGIQADFEPTHKHMFNEFGISLRKSEFYDLALRHYRRALELGPDDENLHHNIARVHWELKDMDNCVRYLEKSLELNPELKESQLFLRYVKKHGQKRKSNLVRELFHLGGKSK